MYLIAVQIKIEISNYSFMTLTAINKLDDQGGRVEESKGNSSKQIL